VPGHASYTGQETWIDTGQGPLPATKEGVKDALDAGVVSVIFCSDAAAEGLNLQAARVVVNVDVPWNPARLEQRIGRIDRMGQRASEVEVYNLWYPQSVEAKMYSRLLARRELSELAVGEGSELISDEIRDQVAAMFGSRTVPRPDALDRLQELRKEIQYVAFQKIWRVDIEPNPPSTIWRKGMLDLVRRVAQREGRTVTTDLDGLLHIGGLNGMTYEVSASPGLRSSLTLSHPALSIVAGAPTARPARPVGELCVLETEAVPYAFGIRSEGRVRLLPPAHLAQILGAIVEGTPIKWEDGWEIPLHHGDPEWGLDTPPDWSLLSRWLPNRSELVTIWPPESDRVGVVPQPSTGPWQVRRLGEVPIEGFRNEGPD
jgi:hypothetical protein